MDSGQWLGSTVTEVKTDLVIDGELLKQVLKSLFICNWVYLQMFCTTLNMKLSVRTICWSCEFGNVVAVTAEYLS